MDGAVPAAGSALYTGCVRCCTWFSQEPILLVLVLVPSVFLLGPSYIGHSHQSRLNLTKDF